MDTKIKFCFVPLVWGPPVWHCFRLFCLISGASLFIQINKKTLPHSKDICQTESFKKMHKLKVLCTFSLGFIVQLTLTLFKGLVARSQSKKSLIWTNPFIHLWILLVFYNKQYPGLVWLLYSLLRPLTWGAAWPILLNLKFSSSILVIFGMVCLITILPLLPKSQAHVFIFWWVTAATGNLYTHTQPSFNTQILLYLLYIIFIATYNTATLSRWYIHLLKTCYWNVSFEGAHEELCQWVHIFSWTYKLLAVGIYSICICHLAYHHPITEKTLLTMIIMQWN